MNSRLDVAGSDGARRKAPRFPIYISHFQFLISYFLLFLTAVIAFPGVAVAAPSLTATRAAREPVIDGKLTDAAWRQARPVTSFIQRSPAEGRAPSQRSELRVLYDQGAVYIGLRLQDSNPELIRRGLGRRDALPDSDRVTVFIDPVGSGKRGYYFQVNASGVISDGVLYQENVMDSSWDGVWSGTASSDGQGWTAELKIPLTSIAYQDRKRQTWGIYVQRYLQRARETSCWPPMPKSSVTFVSRFARLEGLVDLRRTGALYLLPYVGGEFQLGLPLDSTRPDELFRPNGGLDLRYSFSGGGSISITVNPDFGQVEEDPAVVNLGPNEVYFAEKRPFFVEGATIFRTPIMLLHTRRIGARPPTPDVQHDGQVVEVDPEARIGGATKVLGDAGLFSFGLISAFVLPAHADEELSDGKIEELTASPGRHYGAARLLLRPGRSASVGLLLTSMTHLQKWDRGDAYAAGIDWDLRNSSGWQTRGQLSGSTAEEGEGYGLTVTGGQMGAPRWRYWVGAESFSRDYQINDVGYQWRNDMVRMQGIVQHRMPAPWKFLRELHVSLWGMYGFNHTDPRLAFARILEVNSWAQFRNHWEFWGGGGYRFWTLDDRETRGGLPYPRPPEGYFWVGGKTNTSSQVYLDVTYVFASQDEGLHHSIQAALQMALFDRLNCTLFAKYRNTRGYARWVDTVSGFGRDRYIFGDLQQDELDLRLSALLGISRVLTFQVFAQLLYSVATYGDQYLELYPLDDGSGALGPTSYDAQADFASLTMQASAVLRWDLGGGAAAYLVYKMTGELSRDGRPISFDLEDDLSEMADEEQLHLLLLKVSYGWDL